MERLFQRELNQGDAFNTVEKKIAMAIRMALKDIYNEYQYVEPYDISYLVTYANNMEVAFASIEARGATNASRD